MHRRAALIVATTLCSLSPLMAEAQGAQQPAPVPAEVREPPTRPRLLDLPTATVIDSRDVQTPLPPVPVARDGWVVEVIASGGIMGGTRRTVLDSAGSVTCPSSCATKAPPRALVAVTSSVEAASGVAWSSGSPVNVSLCRDCVTTRLSLWRRDADGAIRSFRAQWDPTTAGAVDPAVRRLYDEVMGVILPQEPRSR